MNTKIFKVKVLEIFIGLFFSLILSSSLLAPAQEGPPPPLPSPSAVSHPNPGCTYKQCGPLCCIHDCCPTNPNACIDFETCKPTITIDAAPTPTPNPEPVASCDINGKPDCTENNSFVCPPGSYPLCSENKPGCKVTSITDFRIREIFSTLANSTIGDFINGSCQTGVPFCNQGTVTCTLGYIFSCNGGKPTCDSVQGLPLCENGNTFTQVICKKPSRSGLSSGIDVLSSPEFPDIANLPLVKDELGNIGFSYSGSDPTFEITTNGIFTRGFEKISKTKLSRLLGTDIASIDLIDSKGTLFTNVPFTANSVENNPDRLILTLHIPDEVEEGLTTFILKLKDGQALNGGIQIIESKKINIITIENPNKKPINDQPLINKIRIEKHGKKVTIKLTGSNFVNRQVFYDENGVEIFNSHPGIPDPYTTVTIYPSDLDIKVKRKIVTSRSKFMKIKLELPSDINTPTKGVLVLTTPTGITSQSFVINSSNH